MKTLVTFFFVFIAFFAFSQKDIEISIKTDDGKIIKKDADVFTLTTFKIHGLKTETEFDQLKKTALINSNVAKFEYLAEAEQDGSRKAIASFKNKDENTIIDFLKSINVKKITINQDSFTLDQKEELKKYIKDLKVKMKERAEDAKKRSTSSPN